MLLSTWQVTVAWWCMVKVEPLATLVDTGENTMTGGRLKRVARYIENEGLSASLTEMALAMLTSRKHHFSSKYGKLATITSVSHQGVGTMNAAVVMVVISQKAKRRWRVNKRWFFVLSPKVLDHIPSVKLMGSEPLQILPQWRCGYTHKGFWQPMDAEELLGKLWQSVSPWKLWGEPSFWKKKEYFLQSRI